LLTLHCNFIEPSRQAARADPLGRPNRVYCE